MAKEIISQVLSDTRATYINGVSAQRKISPAILLNLYQGLVEKDGRGINDEFVSTQDATDSAQVFVNRILPVKMNAREMGANVNGGSFSANQHYTQTVTVAIEILQVLDDPIIIPRARQDMIKVDLLAEQIDIYSKRLATILNGATAAVKLLNSWLAPEGKANFKVLDVSGNILNQFVEANSLLDEGDIDNGIDIFPESSRVCVVRPSYRATLKVQGVLNLGGANYAYDIARKAGIDVEGLSTKAEDGYIGDIDGVPCHIISNESLRNAAGFLGLPEREFTGDSKFVGYISSSYANARGVSTSETTKIVDAQAGQGLVLQPYTKFGVASWYPKGNVILSEEEYNPIAWLKGKFATAEFKLKGLGSRLVPVLAATGVVLTSNTAFTLASATAEDDFQVDHILGAYYVVSATKCDTVGKFVKACATGENGAYTIGAAKSFTTALEATEWVNVLVISDDGTVALASAQYTA